MNNLVYLKKDEPMTDSLKVAEVFHKDHGKVLRAIDNIINDSSQNWVQCFRASTYKDAY